MSEKEKKLWNRRWGVVLGALVVTFMVLIGTSGGDPMLDESPKKRWMFFEGWYPMTDSANARIFPYRQLADTTLGAVDTLRFDSPDSGWSWVDIDSSGFYRFAHYNDHAASWVLDSVWVQGKYIAEGYVNLPWALVANVIQAAAISDTSIHPRHVCADSFYVMGIDSGSVIDVDALPAANLLESEFETWFEPSFDESLMVGTYDADMTTLNADSLYGDSLVAPWCSLSVVTIPDDGWIGFNTLARIEFDDQATDEVNILDAWVGIGDATPAAELDVGGGTLTTVDGTDDLLVADDVEVDGDVFIEGGLYVGGFQWDTGSGEMDWAQIETMSGDVLVNDAGLSVVQANALDDETLYSDDTPADGDLVGVGATNKFTHETPAERDIRLTTAPCPMDTTLYGTSTMPNAPMATWYEWKSGVESGDLFDWGYTGAVPYHSVLGELSAYGVSVFSDQNGRVTFNRFPTSTASGGATGMWYYDRGRP